MGKDAKILLRIYQALLKSFGPRKWWPGRTRFEVILGAILTQNVTWKNAKKCLNNLKQAKLLNPEKLTKVNTKTLENLIIPSRYYRQKADKIKKFLNFLNNEYQGSLGKMFKTPMNLLRERLLEIKGIGPETADCILLYAGGQPSFVSDAYTHRFIERYGLLKKPVVYQKSREYFMKNLPEDTALFNDFHAQIVHLGYDFCKAKPLCRKCPARKIDKKIYCVFGRGVK